MRSSLLAPENRRWLTLGSLTFALFMVMLDNTVVNVALPSIRSDLAIGLGELEWIVNAYVLTFAVLLLTGGKLADLFGRRRVFMLGLVVFTVASLGCGLAGSAAVLIGARVLQGVGAALMMPATLSIISATFPPKERGTAIGIWAGVSAMALAIGPLVGGLLTQHIDWSWIFFVNIPVGAAALVAAYLFVPESRDTSRVQSLDLPGLLLSAGTLFALTYGLIEGNDTGWRSTTTLGLFAAAALGLGLFIAVELRRRAPMLDLSLFRNPTFAGANVVALLVTLAMFGVFFFMSLFLQNVLGYSAVQTGASFLPMTILIIVVAPLAGRISDRIGSRWLMTGGMTLVSVHLLMLSRLDLDASFWDVLPAFVLGGLGMSITITPMTAAAISSVPVAKAGVGSGVLNTFRQLGGALGIAVTGAIVAARSEGALAGGATEDEAFVAGFSRGLLVSAAIALGAAAVAALTIRRIRTGETGPSVAGPRFAAAEPTVEEPS